MGLVVQDKGIVVPGETIAAGMDYLPGKGTYRDGEDVVSSRIGLLTVEGRTLKIIPLSGKYVPKKFDVVIGQITDILVSGWLIDIDAPYNAVMNIKEAIAEFIERGADLSHYFQIGDYVVAKISNVTSQNLIDVTMRGPGLHKLKGGRLVRVNTHKVPRVIGKQGSMVSMIKQATNCRITVGQNGIVYLSGEPEMESIAVEAVEYINTHAHLSGLTEAVRDLLEQKTGKKLDMNALAQDQQPQDQ